uniref:Uncharacterized protein n=1 Tax=Arundo donax TaxID=35708 RepID=A0A0A9HC59_ARUDO
MFLSKLRVYLSSIFEHKFFFVEFAKVRLHLIFCYNMLIT